jgi:hypothetical protein
MDSNIKNVKNQYNTKKNTKLKSTYKQVDRSNKAPKKRPCSAEDVIFIFEKTLNNQKPIQIYNELKRMQPQSKITNKWVKKISTGNCRVIQTELSDEKFKYYKELREKVYIYHKNNNYQN